MAPQKRALYDYLVAIAKGGYYDSVDPDIETTLVRSCDSTVVSRQDIDILIHQLNKGEVWALEGENHAMMDSLGRMAMLIQKLKLYDRI